MNHFKEVEMQHTKNSENAIKIQMYHVHSHTFKIYFSKNAIGFCPTKNVYSLKFVFGLGPQYCPNQNNFY